MVLERIVMELRLQESFPSLVVDYTNTDETAIPIWDLNLSDPTSIQSHDQGVSLRDNYILAYRKRVLLCLFDASRRFFGLSIQIGIAAASCKGSVRHEKAL